jgi:peptidoglycan-associated lipoprotein
MVTVPRKLIKPIYYKEEDSMQQTVKTLMVCIFIAAMVCSVACSKKQTAPNVVSDTAPELEETDLGAGEFTAIDPSDPVLSAIFKNILFNYDQFSLTPQALTILDSIAEWMKNNPRKVLMIEGHCDDRGTNEYNLALGDRRANSAKTYLVQLGVDSARIYTISYGEERPLTDGNSESAWAQNRRGEFKLK